MYEYLPIEQAKPGDIVEYQGDDLKWINDSKLHIVSYEGLLNSDSLGVIDKSGNNTWKIFYKGKTLWKLVKTIPGYQAKVGDTVIAIRSSIESAVYPYRLDIGDIRKVEKISNNFIYCLKSTDSNSHAEDFLVLCEADTKPMPDSYFKYFQNLYNNRVKLEYKNDTHPDWITYHGSNEIICRDPTTRFRLASHPNDCPEVGTQEHMDYWEEKRKTQPVYMYSDTGTETKILTNLSTAYYRKRDHKVFFTKEDMQHVAFEDTLPFNESPEVESVLNAQSKEQIMTQLDLKLLLEMMTAMSEDIIDATNAQHLGILTESDGTYVGYVYANSTDELEDVIRQSENEGRSLHVFKYEATLAQKPRKVIKVARD